MAQGFKTGGRRKGIPNKRTGSLVERLLDEMTCDPVGIMAEMAMNPKTPAKLRFLCAKELAQYIAPKRKAIEVTGDPDLIDRPLIEVRWIEPANVPAGSGHAANGSGQIPSVLPPAE